MKVILVNKFHYRKGGSETYYFDVAEGLKRLGHEVHFFAMEGSDNEPCEDADLFVSAKDYNGPSGIAQKVSAATSLIYSKEAKRKFQELCERVRPDVVHMNLVHRQITLSILDAPYIKQHKVPVVFTSHDYILVCPSYVMLDGRGEVCDACLGGRFLSCLKRKCVKGSTAKSGMAFAEAEFLKLTGMYRRIDKIIAPSEFMRDKLVEGGFPPERVVHMQNFAKDEVLESARDNQDRTDWGNPYLLFFGRLSKEKGIDVLVEAASALPDGWRLVVAGDGPDREALGQAAGESPVSDRIEFIGFKLGDELKHLVSGAVFSVASARWRENMPYSIVESMAYGTPVVGTRIGGIPELVSEGQTGFLAEPGDAASLVDAIARAARTARDHAAYEKMRTACREYVLSHCDQSRYMEELTALYEALINKKKETC